MSDVHITASPELDSDTIDIVFPQPWRVEKQHGCWCVVAVNGKRIATIAAIGTMDENLDRAAESVARAFMKLLPTMEFDFDEPELR